MGTNFYARVIPTHEKKEELKKLIDENDFNGVTKLSNEMYGSFETYSMDTPVHGVVHLGKRSGGWKFLWDPNIFIIRHGHSEKDETIGGYRWVVDPDTAYYVYPLTKKGIKDFIDREDVEVYDEYGEKQDKDEFFKEALEWVTWRGEEALDGKTYHEKYPNEREYPINNEYTKMLENEGFEFTNEFHHDFYSDGLRFASYRDFS